MKIYSEIIRVVVSNVIKNVLLIAQNSMLSIDNVLNM